MPLIASPMKSNSWYQVHNTTMCTGYSLVVETDSKSIIVAQHVTCYNGDMCYVLWELRDRDNWQFKCYYSCTQDYPRKIVNWSPIPFSPRVKPSFQCSPSPFFCYTVICALSPLLGLPPAVVPSSIQFQIQSQAGSTAEAPMHRSCQTIS